MSYGGSGAPPTHGVITPQCKYASHADNYASHYADKYATGQYEYWSSPYPDQAGSRWSSRQKAYGASATNGADEWWNKELAKYTS